MASVIEWARIWKIPIAACSRSAPSLSAMWVLTASVASSGLTSMVPDRKLSAPSQPMTTMASVEVGSVPPRL